MKPRDRFLSALAGKNLDYPPVWLMRQAGRYLPEYRALKENYSFLQMVQSPELAAEVTLQPIQRYAFDAAIIFSDILVIPEAMGLPYDFPSGGGIRMERAIQSAADIAALSPDAVTDRLRYVFDALQIVRKELNNETALIGFSGAPWTLAAYMLEGGSSRDFAKAKALFYTEPKLYHQLLEKITAAVIAYLEEQIKAGADAVQLFDSWAGILSYRSYYEMSGQYLRQIVKAIKGKAPVIVFAKGAHQWLELLISADADALGFDWSLPISAFRDKAPAAMAVQGNLDPAILLSNPETIRAEIKAILKSMENKAGWIFNLGHGILPATPLDNVSVLLQTIRKE
ncbi:MAG TPA: uroporphyrinogen decarboxylase [Candidatus Marinimicrobia bacterium]|nr:uroporphyrinogen decarboxylase [Candidatus Neomarinimicrobiota bacterium]